MLLRFLFTCYVLDDGIAKWPNNLPCYLANYLINMSIKQWLEEAEPYGTQARTVNTVRHGLTARLV